MSMKPGSILCLALTFVGILFVLQLLFPVREGFEATTTPTANQMQDLMNQMTSASSECPNGKPKDVNGECPS